jgi:ubiquinone/menaquinone biosynthesis C-methylase UbiE
LRPAAEPALHRELDKTKAEAFAGTLVTALNHGGLCLMVSVGHRTGLFDAMNQLPPTTSDELATRAGLNERYVREWLGAMTAAGVVQVDPTTLRFSLPPEHAGFLTRSAAGDNIATFAQYIAIMGAVEDEIVACFSAGGGIPYSKFSRFDEVMAEDSGQTVLPSLETHVLPIVQGLTDRLTQGARVLDVGCGRGCVLNKLAELYPRSLFVGMDLSLEAISFARDEASRAGHDNCEFVTADLTHFDQTAEPESFDFITTFDAIHDQAEPLNVLKGIHRALRPDGVYLMQEISGSGHVHEDVGHPLGTFLYAISCMHCVTVSLAQGGEGLGAMWGEEKAREYLQKAGFGSIETHRLAHDIQNNWFVVMK